MATSYNGYNRDVPHEREEIDRTQIAIAQKGELGITLGELSIGRDKCFAVLPSLVYLWERGMIRSDTARTFEEIGEDTRLFPVFGTVFNK